MFVTALSFTTKEILLRLKPHFALCCAAASFKLTCVADEPALTNVAVQTGESALTEVAVKEEESAAINDEEATEKTPHRVEVRIIESATVHGDDKDAPKSKVTGKIVIMGPDGKVKEYSLEDKLPDGIRVLTEKIQGKTGDGHEARVFVFDTDDAEVEEQLMIGVHCDIADDVLRAQLKLGESGLVVREVVENSPARESKIQKGDIVFQANGSGLNSVEQLMEIVRTSDGKAIEFGLIRGGERMEVTVTPKKMKAAHRIVVNATANLAVDKDAEHQPLQFFHNLEGQDIPKEVLEALRKGQAGVRVRSLHPGIVIDHKSGKEDIHKLLEEVLQRAEAERDRADAAKEQADDGASRANRTTETISGNAASQSIEDLHAQMKELQQQMATLQKTLEQLTKSKQD